MLDKTTLANQLLANNLRKQVEDVAPDFDFDAFLDPALTPTEARTLLRDRYNIILDKYDDRPVGPDGKICNGGTVCEYCGAEISYNRRTRRFCDNKNRCKQAFYRKRKDHKPPVSNSSSPVDGLLILQ